MRSIRIKNSAPLLLPFVVAYFNALTLPAVAERHFLLSPKILFKVKTDQKVVALSIDDSPSTKFTPEILKVLEKYDAKATFFVIGKRARDNPELIDDIIAGGHEIGNHTMENRFTIFLGRDALRKQIKEFEKIVSISGEPKLFRPGGGLIFNWQVDMVEEMGYKCCLGSLYFADTKLKSASIVSMLTMMNLRPGKIIILHDGKKGRTAQTLEKILPRIRDRGYKVVTISELLTLEEEQ